MTSWVGRDGDYHVASTVAATGESSLNTDVSGKYHEPYLIIPGTGPGSDNSTWFGNYIMRAGDVIKVDGNLATGQYGNTVTDKPVIRDAGNLTGNEIVNVRLIDLISGSTIYDKNVVVEV
jgi:hypothetical protein